MTKDELLKQFTEDFKKTQGALAEVLEHNRAIDGTLVDDLILGDNRSINEHIEISKLIMEGVKGFNDLYKNTPAVLESISKMVDGEDSTKPKKSLVDIMNDMDDKDDKDA